MPLDHCACYSGYTDDKQEDFRRILRMLLKISSSIMRRNTWVYPRYFYIDMNAGPGIVNGKPGSPFIFLQESKSKGVGCKAFFIDRDCSTTDNLRELFGHYSDVTIYCGDNREKLMWSLDTIKFSVGRDCPYGLIYADPNGEIDQLPFDALAAASTMRVSRKIDFLIHIPATNIKRVRSSPFCEYESDLIQNLNKIDKKVWVIREPKSAFQWTFILGTNWGDAPEYKKHGFHRIDTDIGRQILRRLNYTAKELESSNG